MLLKTILNRQAKSYSIQVGFLTPSAMAPTAEMEPATPIRSAQQDWAVVTVLAPWATVSVVPISKAMSPMNGKKPRFQLPSTVVAGPTRTVPNWKMLALKLGLAL